MDMISLAQELQENSYPGRGIVLGRSEDGTKAVAAYFIMGRSENSRNRIFVEEGEGIRTQAFDPSKLTDPSLIIYAPVRVLDHKTIVTNGDQTDTIYEGMEKGLTFEQSLRSREFEPDAPNYTPRISGVMEIENGTYSYSLSILKSNNGDPSCCNRYTFSYENCAAGEGHFIHARWQSASQLRGRAQAGGHSQRYGKIYEHALEQPEPGQQGIPVRALHRHCHRQIRNRHQE